MAVKDDILLLFRKLLPNGLAFKFPYGGTMEKLYQGIIGDESTPYSLVYERLDALNVLDVMIPDNDNFTIDDAHDWYRRLGIYDSGTVSLSDMKAAILQKMSWAVNPINQQHYTYIQAQLVAAGFTDCVLYENRFGTGGESVNPYFIFGVPIDSAICGVPRCGTSRIGFLGGSDGLTKCVNYIEESKDIDFVIGSNYRSTFIVSSASIGTAANVPLARKQEFRQLLLKLKSAQTVGILHINYT